MFLQLFSAATFTQLLGVLADGTATPLVITVSIAAILSFAPAVLAFILRGPPVGP